MSQTTVIAPVSERALVCAVRKVLTGLRRQFQVAEVRKF